MNESSSRAHARPYREVWKLDLVVGVTLLALVVGVGLPSVISAAAPAGPASIGATLSSSSGGMTVGVIARGFPKKAAMVVNFDTSVGVSGTTDGNGGFRSSFSVPAAAAPGSHIVSGTANNM